MTYVHELFEAQAERTPDAVAMVFDESSLTYRDLNQRADDLARQLKMLGVGPDALVALFLERSFDMVVAMLAVLKAGGAYVPLDPIHPPQRLAYMLADSQPIVLLTQSRLKHQLPPHNAHVVAIDDALPPTGEVNSPGNAVRARSPRDLAYVIYTSGSTGNPKGVEIEHRSVVNMLTSIQQMPGLAAVDTMLAITTLVFDIAVLEIFLPLTVGARIVVATNVTTRDGAALGSLIKTAGVTVIQATPSTFRMLLDAGWTGAPHMKILCGGEAWTQELASQLLNCCDSLWNMYGPTETTVWSAVSEVKNGDQVVIGQPIACTTLYVLDGRAQPVAVGILGELYIGGDGLARGYCRRPELTNQRFVSDPFSPDAGARMYCTGDQVLRLQDGTIKFVGRLDHQIKIRGFRIEPGEIEAELRNYPGLTAAVVIGCDDQAGSKRVVAYFVGETDFPPAALRAHLAKGLPEYMIPRAYRRLDALPLTLNGKLDRKALPPIDNLPNTVEFGSGEPGTPTAQAMASIWCEMLALDQIGVHANFFDLGGHSLLAVRVIAKINKTLNAALTIPSFYQDPTISGLERAFERNRGAERGAQLLPLQTGRKGLPLYLIGAGPQEVRLARHIGEDRAVFAIESPIPTGWHYRIAAADQEALPTIEELGALYGDVLYAHAGAPPCVIAGYSFAGKIAFETARLLQRAGGEIACVLLIDAPAHLGEGHSGINFKRSSRWIWQSAISSRTTNVPYLNTIGSTLKNYTHLLQWLLGRVPSMVKNQIEKVKNGISPLKNLSGYLDKNGAPIDQTLMDELHNRAGGAWTPSQLDAAGVLLRVKFPGEEILPGYDSAKGWGNLFGRGLRIMQADGDHMTMVRDENISTLARQIEAVLDQNEIVRKHTVMRHSDNADVGLTSTRPSEMYQLHGQL